MAPRATDAAWERGPTLGCPQGKKRDPEPKSQGPRRHVRGRQEQTRAARRHRRQGNPEGHRPEDQLQEERDLTASHNCARPHGYNEHGCPKSRPPAGVGRASWLLRIVTILPGSGLVALGFFVGKRERRIVVYAFSVFILIAVGVVIVAADLLCPDRADIKFKVIVGPSRHSFLVVAPGAQARGCGHCLCTSG